MKALLIIFFNIFLFQYLYSQEIVDRSQQVPVKINAIFFMPDYDMVNDENAKKYFADMCLGKGQIFTYKGNTQAIGDYQSLVLINAYLYDPNSKKYKPYKEYNLAIPDKTYKFKLLLACMSKVAASPRGAELTDDDIVCSELCVKRNEVDKFKLKYKDNIEKFISDNGVGNQFTELDIESRPINSRGYIPGPRPTTN